MAEQKVIGGPLSQDVLNQLKLRNNIMAKGDRTNEDLRYLISKAGWAKMSSGVNVQGSNALAKQYVLVAGQLGKHGTDSYTNYTETIGYRPMPGITGVEVRSINRFGVLKEATITFNCWSVQQLTDLELLYMRPGFTVLLEWGHSIYTKDGRQPYDKRVETVANFFDDKSISKDKVYREIDKLKKGSAYNYDAILGFVKNFSWSFRADGGYDCTTTVISIGEIIESLQVLLDVSSHSSKGTAVATKDENAPSTILQGVLNFSKNWIEEDYWQQIVNTYPDFARRVGEVNDNALPWYPATLRGIKITDGKQTDKVDFGYITLQAFCQIINALNLTDQTGQPLARINTKIRPVNDNNTTIPSAKYKTFDYHESIDPSTCLIIPPNYSYLYTFKKDTYNKFSAVVAEGASNEILNILVNIDMVQGILSEILQKPVEDRNLFLIFDSIFSKINRALGEINELALHYDEITSTYYIVDRQVEIEDSDVKTLNVTGLSTTVTKFDFTTKLSPSLTTMIAISAQAGGTDVGIDASALLRWNEGLTDRVITVKQVDGNSGGSETAEAKVARQQQERLNVYEKFLEDFYTSQQFNLQTQEKAQANYSQYAKTYINNTDYSKAKSGPAGIVPFEVGIELDGISGIKIGEAFKINEDIMPSKYNGVIGFIVTGVSHKIANNKWTTILKAQTITLKGGLSRTGNKPREKTRQGFTPTTPLTNFTGNNNDAKKAAEVYLGRVMTDDEWSQLVSATFAEASNNQQEMAYVMGVILNRVRSGKWGSTVSSVLGAKRQFQSVTGPDRSGKYGPSPNFVSGPPTALRDKIYGAATNILSTVPKNFINFTAANRAAYGRGTNVGYLDTLLAKGGVQIGQTVFGIG
jgi:hypothetical protein